MLKTGVNTYADIAFSDEYVKNYQTRYAPLRVHWSVLNEAEKEEYLRSSLSQIEKLRFTGKKYDRDQPLQFPRKYAAATCGCVPYPYSFSMLQAQSAEVPEDVKEAQVENALGILSEQINAVSDKQFMVMQTLGAVKNTKYNKREAGDLGFGAELKGGQVNIEIASLRAYQLLTPYLGGGYRC